MSRVYILGGGRTPVAPMDGNLRSYGEAKLCAAAMRLALDLADFDAKNLSEVIVGAAKQTSKPSNLARYAMLDARLPIEVPAYTVHRQSASGMQAVLNGVWAIKSGMASAILAGGCESMTHIPREIHNARNAFNEQTRMVFDPIAAQIEGAQPEKITANELYDRIAQKHGIAAGEAAAYAAESLTKADLRCGAGHICKLEARKGKDLLPVESDQISDKVKTIAGPADGAAMLVLVSDEGAKGKKPIAEILSVAVSAGDPACGIAEAGAAEQALEKSGLNLQELARIEIVEISAAQVLATVKGLGIGPTDARVNPLGGGLATGSPWGASGTVHLVDLVCGMKSGEVGMVINPAEGGQVVCAIVKKM